MSNTHLDIFFFMYFINRKMVKIGGVFLLPILKRESTVMVW
jgi:hypothetical protein